MDERYFGRIVKGACVFLTFFLRTLLAWRAISLYFASPIRTRYKSLDHCFAHGWVG